MLDNARCQMSDATEVSISHLSSHFCIYLLRDQLQPTVRKPHCKHAPFVHC